LSLDDVHKHLSCEVAQDAVDHDASFEILQSTMRGIYQRASAQQAVEEMTSQSRDLEMRMNEQRKSGSKLLSGIKFSDDRRLMTKVPSARLISRPAVTPPAVRTH